MSCSNNIVNTCGCGNPNPCGCKTSSDEVVYVGPELGCTGISNCDTVTEAFIKIDSFICGPGMVETIINNILNNVNLYNQFTTIVNNSVDCETVWGCIDSTTTTTSTSTAYPCQGYNLDNLSLDTVIISVTDCVTGLSTPVVLLPGITAVCIETASELIVPGVVNATPTGPCNTTTTTSSSTTSTTTTIYIPCQCITFTNTDNSAVDHNISYNNCVGEVIDTIITSSEVLKVCGCCAIADNPLVIISIGADCIDAACPTTTTTTTVPPTTTTTTTVCDVIASFVKINYGGTDYQNGDPIPQVTDPTTWSSLTTGAWCWYDNDPFNEDYGKLYNWYAVNDPRGFAPVGYHVPSKTEFACYINTLAEDIVAGGKMKQVGLAHWDSPNTGASDTSGFTAFGAGQRNGGTGDFESIREKTGFWTSTIDTLPLNPDKVSLFYNSELALLTIDSKKVGLSVRLIQD
jgi:uncharacterized protein (TIGR02145 family)